MLKLTFICIPIFALLIFLWLDEENPLVKLLAVVVLLGLVGVMVYLTPLGDLLAYSSLLLKF